MSLQLSCSLDHCIRFISCYSVDSDPIPSKHLNALTLGSQKSSVLDHHERLVDQEPLLVYRSFRSLSRYGIVPLKQAQHHILLSIWHHFPSCVMETVDNKGDRDESGVQWESSTCHPVALFSPGLPLHLALGALYSYCSTDLKWVLSSCFAFWLPFDFDSSKHPTH